MCRRAYACAHSAVCFWPYIGVLARTHSGTHIRAFMCKQTFACACAQLRLYIDADVQRVVCKRTHVCVCMHIMVFLVGTWNFWCAQTCASTCKNVYAHTYTGHTHANASMILHARTCMCTRMHSCACGRAQNCLCQHVCARTLSCVRVHAHRCARECNHVQLNSLWVCAHIHVQTHIDVFADMHVYSQATMC